jgi:hypothetical protein
MAWLNATGDNDLDRRPPLTPEQLRRRRNRSIAMAVALGALVLIMIAITLVKGPASFVRPI